MDQVTANELLITAEELEFRVVTLSHCVQSYGFMLQAAAAMQPTNPDFIKVLKHQMDMCQQLAVKNNAKYADIMARIEMWKRAN
jgi:hypothetical protein